MQIVPHSIVLVLLGDRVSSGYSVTQRAIGNWSLDPVAVRDLFARALLLGLRLVALYMAYQVLMAVLKPDSLPTISRAGIGGGDWARRVTDPLIPPVC